MEINRTIIRVIMLNIKRKNMDLGTWFGKFMTVIVSALHLFIYLYNYITLVGASAPWRDTVQR